MGDKLIESFGGSVCFHAWTAWYQIYGDLDEPPIGKRRECMHCGKIEQKVFRVS